MLKRTQGACYLVNTLPGHPVLVHDRLEGHRFRFENDDLDACRTQRSHFEPQPEGGVAAHHPGFVGGDTLCARHRGHHDDRPEILTEQVLPRWWASALRHPRTRSRSMDTGAK